ncbi:Retrotransposon gag protein [Corchorus olitorius]|uniref:Retrotransposon gag protein n=1 Tax=Corchorus olitorius TaxID=93759 RepID=A0A1R3G3K1_9ROSI|nr:Retrotransposon gag protein [Corchorus olitorius]
MGDGVTTRIQKEIAAIQQNYTDLNTKVDSNLAQIRMEMQNSSSQLREEMQSSLEKVSLDLKQFIAQCLRKPPMIDLGSGSKSQAISTPADSTSQDSSTRPYTKHSKLECPKFDGSDFMGWHHRILQFFEADSTPEHTRIRTVMMHLEGRALQWHLNYMRANESEGQVHWNQYILGMRERFGCNQYRNPLSELIALKQIGSVDDYYDQFESLLNLLKLSDEDAMSFFITNLKSELHQQVNLSQPKSLAQAVNYARYVESLMNGSAPLSMAAMSPAFKTFLNPNTNTKQSTYTQCTHTRNPTLLTSSNQQGLLTYIPPKQSSSTEKLTTNTKNSYVPTRVERDEHKKQGLCMWCAAKYAPGHKCGVKAQLYQMFLEGTIEPSTDDSFVDCVEFMDDTAQTGNDAENTPVISLNALLGCVGPRTMRIAGKIKNLVVMMLVDSGSTHNFLDTTLAKRLGCTIQTIKGLDVQVANGKTLRCQEVCSQLHWEVQGLSQQSDVFLVSLLGCDMVLGIEWLKTLGPIWWDFSLLVMKFVFKGVPCTLTGLNAGPVQLFSDKQASKQSYSEKSLFAMLVCTGTPQLCSMDTIPSTLAQLPQDLQALLLKYADALSLIPQAQLCAISTFSTDLMARIQQSWSQDPALVTLLASQLLS